MFLNNQIDDIPLQHLAIQYFYVLPRMTRGRLISVSKQITPCEWIKTKEDMRKYWKTTYGYELPITFGEIFCNIRFGNANIQNGHEVFCYPIEVRCTQCYKIRKKCNFKSAKTHYLHFQKWQKINFCTRKKV